MENTTRNIVVVTSERINLPSLGICMLIYQYIKFADVAELHLWNLDGAQKNKKKLQGTARLTVHAPQLDLSVVSSGNNERLGWVKTRPINSTIVSFKNELDEDIRVAKQFVLKSLTGVFRLCVRCNIFLAKSYFNVMRMRHKYFSKIK